MNILVTGGYGFIGMYLTKQLAEDGHNVFIYDLIGIPPEGFDHAKQIRGDLLDQRALFEAVYTNKIDRIVNLAALRNNDSQRLPYQAYKVNCEGFLNCLEAARVFGLSRVVYASTVAVLGDFSYYRDNGYDEDRIYQLPEQCAKYPTNVYGVTKLLNEQIGAQYANIYGLSVIGARLPLIFGAGKKSGSKTSTFNDMIISSMQGDPITVNLRPDKFNIIYVKDAAYGLYRATVAGDPEPGIYNICGATVDHYEYAAAITEVLPKADITIQDTGSAAVPVNTCMDPAAASAQIGYKPQYSLKEGILDYADMVS
jgi:nucleoside-diphosphate-sugar epimerase